tara:strand:+ start:280 stop:927 length:648 start_codon:yes stop_codon:yes gene_type:complete
MMNIPMYRLNAVKSIRFKDSKLNKLLNKAHVSFSAVLSSYQGDICKNKNDIISLIKCINNQMKNSDINELNKMCKINAAADAKLKMFSRDGLTNPTSSIRNIEFDDDMYNDESNATYINSSGGTIDSIMPTTYTKSESNYFKDVIKHSPETIKMAKNIFDIYAYAAIKYFCKGDKFDIEMLKEYLIAMVEDSCSDSSNTNQMVNIAYNFITRKTL